MKGFICLLRSGQAAATALAAAVAAFLLIAITAPATAAGDQQQAAKFLDKLSSDALRTLSVPGITLGQKEAAVRKLLADNFDLNLIGRFVIGPAWRKASPDQRDRYQTLFREFVLRTYSRRLGGYSGQQFKVTGTRTIGKSDVLVSTRINRPSGPPIIAGWRVRESAGGYKILDVVVSGVSMVVTQRSEFRAVLRRQGFDGLIEMLRLQVSKFSARRS